MATQHPKRDDATQGLGDRAEVVPLPSSDTKADHDRVRKSNDRDQQLEREGKTSPHNEGYDEAADGPTRQVVDEP